MDYNGQIYFPPSITQFPGLVSEIATFSSDCAVTASMAADGIVPGTSAAGLYNQALIKDIQEQQNLIATLSGIAASTPSAAGWATWDMNYLEALIGLEGTTLSNDGGSINGLSPEWNTAGLSSGDASAVADLYHFGSYGNVDLAALSQIVGNDGSSTIIGEDAAAVLAAYSAGANPFFALNVLFNDAANPNITSSTTNSNPASLFTPATFSSLSLPDSSAVADLYQFGAHGNIDLATLSQIVGRDTTSTIIGQDAAAVLAAYSAGVNPFMALGHLFMDAQNPNITSNTSTGSTSTGSTSTVNTSTVVSGTPAYDYINSAASAALLNELSPPDASAMLSLLVWGPTTSVYDMETLSGIVGRDGTSTIIGATAEAGLQLISAGAGLSSSFFNDLYVAAPNASQTTVTIGSDRTLSTQDLENFIVASEEYDAGKWNAMRSTLSALATSSDSVIASIASADLLIAAKDGASAVSFVELDFYLNGGTLSSSVMAPFTAEFSSATGSPMSWTGSNFVPLLMFGWNGHLY